MRPLGWVAGVALALAVLGAGAPARAMSFSFMRADLSRLDLGTVQTIYASGPIERGDAEQLRAAAKAWGLVPGGEIVLDSPGGDTAEGLELGQAIRDLRLSTRVRQKPAKAGDDPRPGKCLSACSFAYLGGQFRYLDPGSVIGVHRFTAEHDLGQDRAQLLSAAIVGYIREMGADPALFEEMADASPESIRILDRKRLLELKVVNDGVEYTRWSFEDRGNGPYLKGEQKGPRGLSKLMFRCSEGKAYAEGLMWSPDARRAVDTFKRTVWRLDAAWQDPAPAERLIAAPITQRAVGFVAVLSRPRLEQLLKADEAGFSLVDDKASPLYAGFEVRMSDGREKLKNFYTSCTRRAR